MSVGHQKHNCEMLNQIMPPLIATRALGTTLALAAGVVCAQQPDILVADFEAATYGNWTISGAAFGSGPASGTLPNQMPVAGYRGDRLINSFHGGDDSTGTLTSPPFKVERKFIQFLVGGGGWEGKTCINLLIEGRIVRTATGPNTQSGGSEQLGLQQWEVSEFLNQTVVLQIVDQATGGWGHINVDHIVQTDQKVVGVPVTKEMTRSIRVQEDYLNLPIKNGAPNRRMSLLLDGKVEREFDIELADGKPDWWAFMDATPFKGRTVTLKVNKLPEDSLALSAVDQSEKPKDQENLYLESLRPQFHFSSRRGWLNDPNGLVYYKGEYHLFYQHNPYGWGWGNMHWGHAVSKDLVHWQELPVALYPDEHGTMFSGSAVVDWNNTTGFQTGEEKPLVTMFTAAGKPFTQGIAFSNNRGRTWTKYKNNPVLAHIAAENRDPKVVWYAPSNYWVMALYLDKSDYALFSSPDLKRWRKLSDVSLPGDSECPDFFEIAVVGEAQNRRWIFYGANGMYLVGKFDGATFIPETKPLALHHGNTWYASQTYSDIPATDGRRILVPWGRNGDLHRGMPFNQMMGLPVELTLRNTADGLRLRPNPVKELATLRNRKHVLERQTVKPGANPLADVKGELFEVLAELTPGAAEEISFNLRGVAVTYDTKKQTLSCLGKTAALPLENGKIRLRMLVDRTSVDIFGNDGQLYMPMGVVLAPDNKSFAISAKGGEVQINSMETYELKSAWK